MKITKMRVDGRTIVMERTSKEGQLVYEGIDENKTEEIIFDKKKESFYKSILNKTVRKPNKKEKDKRKIAINKAINKEITELMSAVLNQEKPNLKLHNLKSLDRNALTQLFKHDFQKTISYPPHKNAEHVKFCLADLAVEAIQDIDATNPDWAKLFETLKPYTDWAESYIHFKQTTIQKSIEQNKIQSAHSPRKLVLHKYATAFLEGRVIGYESLAAKYQLADLAESFKVVDLNKDKNANYEIKKILQQHQRNILGELKTDPELNQYGIEVKKYIERYFPIKSKPKRNKHSRADFLKKELIESTVKQQFKNAVYHYVLEQGKMDAYNLTSPKTKDLQNIRAGEAFSFKFINACAFASNNLKTILNPECEKDILFKNDFIQNLPDSTTRPNVVQKMIPFFSDEIQNVNFNEAIWAIRGSIQKIRNEVYHCKKHAWEKILKIKGFEYRPNMKYADTEMKNLMDNDIAKIPVFIEEKLKSSGVVRFYRQEDLQSIWERKQGFSLLTTNAPFVPSFKRVFAKGHDYQTSRNRKYDLALTIFDCLEYGEEDFRARYFLTKLVYYQQFMPWFTTDSSAFREAANFVLHLNKNRQQDAKAFTNIREVEKNELPRDYMSYVQGQIAIHEDATEDTPNHFEKFINQIFIKGFDKYMIASDLVFIQSPENQELEQSEIDEMRFDIQVTPSFLKNKDDYISFWTFCKMLDAKHLSELRNEMIKYNGDLTEEQEIIGLALLGVDSRENDWKQFFSSEKGYEDVMKGYVGDALYEREPYRQSDGKTPVLFRGVEQARKYGTETVIQRLFDANPEFKVSQSNIAEWERQKETIEGTIKRRKDLHDAWAENPKKPQSDAFLKEYKACCEAINTYNWHKNKATLVYVNELHHLLIDILGRLVGYVAIADRDFQCMANQYLKSSGHTERVDSWINTTEKYWEKIRRKTWPKHIEKLHKFMVGENLFVSKRNDRNRIAHLNYLSPKNKYSLLYLFEKLREMLKYDRKLKNAVTKSLIDLLDKHGMCVVFANLKNNNHRLVIASLKPKKLRHLSGKKLNDSYIETNQVSEEYCSIVKALLEM
ncbi:type VI-A CRISPR-associated RNA-guided ribonuclease Cas13a [Listeria booriae]|uniref:type VI-A CRISPR-associated RNA-guided ribonuclease Cas13a n=1 Tax=Listeria booriae TaxID=1552123 RepID=UPI001625E9DB|nr:type VI-A CRISPR-associated RNA-guided ribonuclease Cas13a [Listeria booriae]